jgi:hypothetical protein
MHAGPLKVGLAVGELVGAGEGDGVASWKKSKRCEMIITIIHDLRRQRTFL